MAPKMRSISNNVRGNISAKTIPVLARAQLWALVGARNTPVAAIQKYSRVIVNYSREDDYFTERKPTHKIVR